MEGIIVGCAVAFIGQFTLLWYRIGKMEQKLKDLCREVRESNSKKEK